MEIEESALKSTRLVMNLTKNPKSSKIIADTDIWENREEEELLDFSAKTTTKNHDRLTSDCVEWKNENQPKSIVLDLQDIKMPLDHRNIDPCEFTFPLSKETENIHENTESFMIGRQSFFFFLHLFLCDLFSRGFAVSRVPSFYRFRIKEYDLQSLE